MNSLKPSNWQGQERILKSIQRDDSIEKNKCARFDSPEFRIMSQVQLSDTLHEWRESAKYWETHAQTIQKMFAPVTAALIEDAGIIEGDTVLDVAGGPGEPSLTI